MGKVWVRRRNNRPGRPWVCAWHDRSGPRRQQTFKTRAEADLFAADKTRELAQAAPTVEIPYRITVREYAERWLAQAQAGRGLKRRSLEYYRGNLDRHILPALGSNRIRDIHQGHVQAVLVAVAQAAGDGAAQAVYATLRRLLERARFEGLLMTNPARGLWRELPLSIREARRSRRRDPQAIKAMSAEQLQAFVVASRTAHLDIQTKALLFTLARAGLRLGEALGLQLADVDVSVANEIQVRRTLGAARGADVSIEDRIGTPKTHRERTVEIGDELAEVLADQLTHRREQNLHRGWTEDQAPWLFSVQRGDPLDEHRVRKAFAKVLRAAELPGRFTPHSLRHTYASLMLAAGADLVWLSKQLGHATPQTTLDFYSWALPTGNRAFASLLDSKQAPKESQLEQAAVGMQIFADKLGDVIAARSVAQRWPKDETGTRDASQVPVVVGADARIRTEDLLITNCLGTSETGQQEAGKPLDSGDAPNPDPGEPPLEVPAEHTSGGHAVTSHTECPPCVRARELWRKPRRRK